MRGWPGTSGYFIPLSVIPRHLLNEEEISKDLILLLFDLLYDNLRYLNFKQLRNILAVNPWTWTFHHPRI